MVGGGGHLAPVPDDPPRSLVRHLNPDDRPSAASRAGVPVAAPLVRCNPLGTDAPLLVNGMLLLRYAT